jgi:hypothetical protein
MRGAAFLALAMILAACATNAVISDIATDKVKVVASGNDQAVIMGQARDGCAHYKRTPVAISKRCIDAYCIQSEYLFACKEAE